MFFFKGRGSGGPWEGADVVVMIERDLVVVENLWEGLQWLKLMDNSSLRNDCDNDNVGKAAYLSEGLHLKDGDGYKPCGATPVGRSREPEQE